MPRVVNRPRLLPEDFAPLCAYKPCERKAGVQRDGQEGPQSNRQACWQPRVRMRRMMLGMSQEKLGDAYGLTFQQVQKYEKGTNRISASRLQQSAHILQVPVTFFFEGVPHQPGQPKGLGEAPAYVFDFLATSDGLALTKAFMRIKESKLRRRI